MQAARRVNFRASRNQPLNEWRQTVVRSSQTQGFVPGSLCARNPKTLDHEGIHHTCCRPTGRLSLDVKPSAQSHDRTIHRVRGDQCYITFSQILLYGGGDDGGGGDSGVGGGGSIRDAYFDS
jgi:hypothetical protein